MDTLHVYFSFLGLLIRQSQACRCLFHFVRTSFHRDTILIITIVDNVEDV